MDVKDFYYDLPQELIAQDPLEDRSSSRLLVLDKKTGEMQHKVFKDIVNYLHPGDCLVINDTKVIPARLIGSKEGTDAHIEILLLKRRENDIWEMQGFQPIRRSVYHRRSLQNVLLYRWYRSEQFRPLCRYSGSE